MTEFTMTDAEKAVEAYATSRTFPVEVVVAAALMCWGIILLNPYTETFGGFSVQFFAPMANIAPEEVWGGAALTLGLLMLGGIWLSPKYFFARARWAVLVLTAGFFGFAAAMQFQGNPGAPGWGLSAIFALSAIWSVGGGRWRAQ